MKEWYLIGNKTKPNMLGGYENQSFIDYKEDAFAESLETDIATTVSLFNSDLSEKKEIRCIIQGNLADSQVQSTQRKGLFLCNTVKDGMYVFFDNGYWLIIGYPGTNGIYEKAIMYLCQFKLIWQNSDGKIIERWVYSEDFTKYSSGISGNNTITVGDNQYGLTLPIDYETKKLKRDMRFPIDFEDSECPDIYRLTNRKVKINDNSYSGRGGTMIVTMSFDTFNSSTDHKVVTKDGKEVWICDYKKYASSDVPQHPSGDETAILSASISGEQELHVGFANTYSVMFTGNSTGSAIDLRSVNFSWNVISDFYIEQTIIGNEITLLVEDRNAEDEKIILQATVDGVVLGEIVISVSGIM